MFAATEFEIEVSKGRINLPNNLPDGIYKLVMESETCATKCTATMAQQCKEFVRIPASELSLAECWFSNFRPDTLAEENFYKEVKEVIKEGVKDFWRPKYDPSLTEDGTKICYLPGKKPITGKNYEWWNERTKEFNPKCKSRLGTKSEYVAFLAVLIKSLVASGWEMANAWNAVCNDSKELGHYCNSRNAKDTFEYTGSRRICEFYDLGNTIKMLAKDKQNDRLWLTSGSYKAYSTVSPLAERFNVEPQKSVYTRTTGWLILECNPDQ